MKSRRYNLFLRAARAALAEGEEARVPYAFEKRIMARIREAGVARPADIWKALAPTMWRAAFTCLAISILTGAVVRYGYLSKPSELFAGDLERTVLAPVDVDDTW